MNLVQTHKCSFSIMGPHFSKIKLCFNNELSEIKFEVHHVFISQKLKKLKKEKRLPFGPSCTSNFL